MQRRPHRFASTLAGCALGALVATFSRVAPARADAPDAPAGALRLPIVAAQRPITVPSLVFDPRLTFDVRHQEGGTAVNFGVGGAFGVTDDFTVRALVLPLQLAAPIGRSVQYGQTTANRGPSIGAAYRFVHGSVEVGAALDVRVLTVQYLSGVAIIPSIPIRIHASDVVRIDVEPSVNITRATSTGEATIGGQVAPATVALAIPTATTTSANAVRVEVPISVLYNVSEPFHLGANSGLTIYDVDKAKNTTGIPLGVFFGYAVAGQSGPVLDIDPFFEFPYLVMPGRDKVTNTEQYIAGINLTGHVYW